MFFLLNKLKLYYNKLKSLFSKKNKKNHNQDDIYPLW